MDLIVSIVSGGAIVATLPIDSGADSETATAIRALFENGAVSVTINRWGFDAVYERAPF